MGYRNTKACLEDLERAGHLLRVDDEVDPHLEAAEIHRRVFTAGGPALWFTHVRGCRFSMASNLFGTIERARFMFRDTLAQVKRLIALKTDPTQFWNEAFQNVRALPLGLAMRPKRVGRGPVQANQCSISDLPQLQSWPDDGGAFITLPQVYSESVGRPGPSHANLGMYRVQLSGGNYQPDQIGLHYQIHRGIGVHHTEARQQGAPFRVNIFVGGTPSMTLAAVMPLPEGMSELTFAGALAGHRVRMIRASGGLPLYGDADFCICGTVDHDRMLPEGPFGDHLGYYSLVHDFPVLSVEKVYHRDDAVWPFTVVGRPPQEDTVFGQLIHELTEPVIPTVIAGVHAVNAVDAAGVHPLLLAIGSERYTPYQQLERPQELLTQGNAILGQVQMSWAKYLWIANRDDNPSLDIHDIEAFFRHMLERVDWSRDLHFQTRTTIDTLDYSGTGMNQGSKVVVAAVGPRRRDLPGELPSSLRLADPLKNPQVCFPGVMAVEAGPYQQAGDRQVEQWVSTLPGDDALNAMPLIVVVDDSAFVAESLRNFLWVTFTRSDPARDIYGIGSSITDKHWGCEGSLVIDARIKPHHAPPLVEDPEITRRVDALAARGGELGKWL